MTKKGFIVLLLVVLVAAVGGYVFYNQQSAAKGPIAKIENDLYLENVKGKLVTSWDNHAGLSASGSAYAELQLKGESVAQQIAQSDAWKPLPMDEAMQVFVYGLTKDGKRQGPIFCDDHQNPVFPQVAQGYYCFADRSPDAEGNDAAAALARGVQNVSFGLYDADTNTLYYGELDV